jgi:hypothetical protein
LGGFRLDNSVLWTEYTTYSQLASQYNCSVRTIQRRLDAYQLSLVFPTIAREVIVLMDTTYWGRGGLMLFKDAITKENLLKYYVNNETNSLYFQGISELQRRGFTVVGIVCDGRKGLL